MRSNIPTRTSERIYAESYLDYKNDMFIFIEDIDENSRKIMLELIQRAIDKNIKIDRLHSCGNRKKVIEKFNERNSTRKELYIIDGDLNMLFENQEFQKGLVILNKYCIEKYNDLGIETVSFSINLLRNRIGKGILCSCSEELINKRIEDLKKLIIEKIGNNKFINDESFIENKINNRNSDIIVSAKDYILPLIFDRLKKFAKNTSSKNETLKFRLARMINIESFKENLEPHLKIG